jgi:hypothetical protein
MSAIEAVMKKPIGTVNEQLNSVCEALLSVSPLRFPYDIKPIGRNEHFVNTLKYFRGASKDPSIFLIGFSGKLGSGKTVTANELATVIMNKLGVSTMRLSFANVLREVLSKISLVPVEKTKSTEDKNTIIKQFGMTIGVALQKLGQAVCDGFHPESWVVPVQGEIENLRSTGCCIIMDDVRKPVELRGLIETMGGKCLFVRLEGDPSGIAATSTRDKTHYSEVALDKWPEEFLDKRLLLETNKTTTPRSTVVQILMHLLCSKWE